MKWRAEITTLGARSFEIEHDPAVGFYLFVYEGGKCIRDHLQDTLEIAMQSAQEDYGIPIESWREVEK